MASPVEGQLRKVVAARMTKGPVLGMEVVPHVYNEISPIVQWNHLFCNIVANCYETRLLMGMDCLLFVLMLFSD